MRISALIAGMCWLSIVVWPWLVILGVVQPNWRSFAGLALWLLLGLISGSIGSRYAPRGTRTA